MKRTEIIELDLEIAERDLTRSLSGLRTDVAASIEELAVRSENVGRYVSGLVEDLNVSAKIKRRPITAVVFSVAAGTAVGYRTKRNRSKLRPSRGSLVNWVVPVVTVALCAAGKRRFPKYASLFQLVANATYTMKGL